MTNYILKKKRKNNDVATDVTQHESSSIKRYASFFFFFSFKPKRLTQNPKAEPKRLWGGLDSGTK